MNVKDLLAQKHRDPITISGEITIRDAMAALDKHKIGSLVVVDDDKVPVGIITERDIFRLTLEFEGDIMERAVGEHMTRDVLVGVPEDDVDYIAQVITQNRIRHIPIIDNDNRLCGIVSIGDILKVRLKEAEIQVRHLTEYIIGRQKTHHDE
jgi:CBS domain-containing protein